MGWGTYASHIIMRRQWQRGPSRLTSTTTYYCILQRNFTNIIYKPDVGKAIWAKRRERRTTTNGHRCRERERCELRNRRDTFTLNFTAPRTTDGSRGQRRLSYCRTRWRKPRFRNTWSLENNNRRGCHHRAKQLLSVRGSCARSIQRPRRRL